MDTPRVMENLKSTACRKVVKKKDKEITGCNLEAPNTCNTLDTLPDCSGPKRLRSDSNAEEAVRVDVDADVPLNKQTAANVLADVTMDEDESVFVKLNQKWAARQADSRNRKPDLLAGLHNVEDREHLIFSGKIAYDAKYRILDALRKMGCKIPYIVPVAATKNLPLSAPGIQPLVRVLLETPLPDVIQKAISSGILAMGSNTWGVRRGHSPRMPNVRTWTIHTQCPKEQLKELWEDFLESLRSLYMEEEASLPNGIIRQGNDLLLRPGAWNGEVDTSNWVQLECADRTAVAMITAAIRDMEAFWPIKNRGDNAVRVDLQQIPIPSQPGRLHIRGFKATVAQADVRQLVQQYGEVRFVEVHYTENNRPTATVIMESLPNAIRLRADLDGYDASDTISQGPLTVIPQPWIAAAGGSETSDLCFICQSGHHVPDRCPQLYNSRKVIHDRREPAAGRLTAQHRCAHCMQIECSIPCVWSWEWSQIHKMDLVIRGVEDPAKSIDLTESMHEVVSPIQQVVQGKAVYITPVSGKRPEGPVSYAFVTNTRQQERATVNRLSCSVNSPIMPATVTPAAAQSSISPSMPSSSVPEVVICAVTVPSAGESPPVGL